MNAREGQARALVTGGSGYFGNVLVDMLRAAGERVRVFDLIDNDDRPRDVDFRQGDIRSMDQILAACDGIDVVYHCVAQVPLARNKKLFEEVNIQGLRNLLQAAKTCSVRKIVVLSSSAIFGIPKQNPVTEDTPPQPVEAYGRTKVMAEAVVQEFVQRDGMDISIVRPRTILGHGRLGIFQLLFEWISEGRDAYLLGDGSNVYQFVHAEDLAAACTAAAARSGPGVYNIGAETFGTMRSSIEGLIAHAATGSRIRFLPKGLAAFGMKVLSTLRLAPFAPYHWLLFGESLYFDVSRARQELNWRPKWSNVDMLCQSYDWYLAHREKVMAEGHASAHRSPVKMGLLRVLSWFS